MPDPHDHARRIAAEHDDPVGWFDELYRAVERGEAQAPWDHADAHPLLRSWTDAEVRDGTGRTALVVGCGTSGDAEHLASCGFATTAFDVSEAAIRGVRARFPGSSVEYRTADLLDLPDELRGTFDLVFELMTVQALPPAYRERATAGVAATVAPGGTLLVVMTASDTPVAPAAGPPWPLTRAEMEAFATGGLELGRLELLDSGGAPRWRAELRRTA